PTVLASAGVSSLAQRPPALRKKFPLTHLSLCVLLSSAYPFSACSNRQTFVQNSRKGTPTYFLFPHLLIVARLISSSGSACSGPAQRFQSSPRAVFTPRRAKAVAIWRNDTAPRCCSSRVSRP